MSFVNFHYIYYVLITYIVFILIIYMKNQGYFKWIKTYWFLEQSNWNKLSNLMYGLAIFLFLISLLDLRGPETKVRTSLPDQRTIIILDTSSSMLCEDVRPSRFVKSLQLARHFVKNAAGHQIAIVLFSDLQKRLIPFTDDIDLIDSRLAALEKTNTVSGGTNISQAITESVSYFETDLKSSSKNESGGNILVFTDAEEGDDNFKLELSKNINLGIVGVGTAKGGTIPLRWDDGSYRGYKTNQGQNVITRLDENYIKSIGKNVKNFKYWIANSYSMPTEEIMNFFRSTYNLKNNNGDMRVRPVYSYFILIPAIIIYCIAVLLGRIRSFKTIQSILVICLMFGGLKAEEVKPKLSPKLNNELVKIQEGKASRIEILKTAEDLLSEKQDAKAAELYSEYAKKNDDEAIRFNQATALLKSRKFNEAMPIIQELMKNSKNEDLKNKMRSNLSVSLVNEKEKKEQEKKKDEKEKEDKNKKDEESKKDNKDSKDNKDNKDQKKNQDDKKDKKDGKSSVGQNEKNEKGSGEKKEEKEQKKEEKKDDKKNEKKNEKDKENQDQEKQEQKPQNLEQKEKEIEQKRRMTKTPSMIKQIMSDDRDLQKKLMDTSTKDNGNLRPKRDW